jgi:hypothetical protein
MCHDPRMTPRAGALRWQQIAWLGLCILPCLVVGAWVGRLLAGAIDIPLWIGQVAGLVAGYLTSRTILRGYFARRL